jgi:hypothetical protein
MALVSRTGSDHDTFRAASIASSGSAVVPFETSQAVNHNQLGIAVKQIENGLIGILDALPDGTFADIDSDRYDAIPER